MDDDWSSAAILRRLGIEPIGLEACVAEGKDVPSIRKREFMGKYCALAKLSRSVLLIGNGPTVPGVAMWGSLKLENIAGDAISAPGLSQKIYDHVGESFSRNMEITGLRIARSLWAEPFTGTLYLDDIPPADIGYAWMLYVDYKMRS
jgi:hypothetical protein